MFQDVGLDQQEEGLGGSSQHIQSVGLGRLGRIEHNPRSHPLWSGDDLRTAPTDGFQFLTNVHYVSMMYYEFYYVLMFFYLNVYSGLNYCYYDFIMFNDVNFDFIMF